MTNNERVIVYAKVLSGYRFEGDNLDDSVSLLVNTHFCSGPLAAGDIIKEAVEDYCMTFYKFPPSPSSAVRWMLQLEVQDNLLSLLGENVTFTNTHSLTFSAKSLRKIKQFIAHNVTRNREYNMDTDERLLEITKYCITKNIAEDMVTCLNP